MERYARYIIRNRILVVVGISLVTLILGFEATRLKMAIKLREQLPQEHSYVQIQNTIEDIFGGDSPEVIGVFAKRGTIYDPAIMGKVVRLTNGVLAIPGVVRSSVLSLASPNVRSIESVDDNISIQVFIEEPVTPERVRKMQDLLSRDTLVRDNLVSEDATATVIAMDVGSVADAELQKNLSDLVERERDDTVEIVLAGGPTLRTEITRYTALAFPLLVIAIVLIALIHYHAFRTMQAAFLPIVTAILSMVWSMGILGATGQLMDTWSSVTPIAILAVAAGHAVQILKRYYEELKKTSDSHEAIVRTLCAVGPVMIRVCIIAALGFGSLMFMSIRSVRVFGLLLAAGITSAMVIEMTLIPAVRAMMTPSKKERDQESREGWLERIMERLALWITRNPILTSVSTILITFVIGCGAFFVRVDNNVYNWLPHSSQVRKDYDALNTKLKGATSLKILFEAKESEALKRPDVLKALNSIEEYMRGQYGLSRVSGLADIVRRMNRVMDGKDTIPESPSLIAQYLMLYEGSGPDALSSVVDGSYDHTVIQAFSNDDSTGFAESVFGKIRTFAEYQLRDLPVDARIAGGAIGINAAMDQVVIQEKETSVMLVACVIFVLSSVFLSSLWGGVFVTIPMVLALVVNVGLMGWCGIWFNMSSSAISAMGVSFGADFAVYLLYRVREEMSREPSFEIAVQHALLTRGDEASREVSFEIAVYRALLSSGKAIFFVSSAIVGGYLILCLSPFVIWQHLGLLTAWIISVHALSAITILPALILIFRPRFLQPKTVQ